VAGAAAAVEAGAGAVTGAVTGAGPTTGVAPLAVVASRLLWAVGLASTVPCMEEIMLASSPKAAMFSSSVDVRCLPLLLPLLLTWSPLPCVWLPYCLFGLPGPWRALPSGCLVCTLCCPATCAVVLAAA